MLVCSGFALGACAIDVPRFYRDAGRQGPEDEDTTDDWEDDAYGDGFGEEGDEDDGTGQVADAGRSRGRKDGGRDAARDGGRDAGKGRGARGDAASPTSAPDDGGVQEIDDFTDPRPAPRDTRAGDASSARPPGNTGRTPPAGLVPDVTDIGASGPAGTEPPNSAPASSGPTGTRPADTAVVNRGGGKSESVGNPRPVDEPLPDDPTQLDDPYNTDPVSANLPLPDDTGCGTYEAYWKLFFDAYCNHCHGQGTTPLAPLDTLARLNAQKSEIRERVIGPTTQDVMPPAWIKLQPTPDEKARLAAWLSCNPLR